MKTKTINNVALANIPVFKTFCGFDFLNNLIIKLPNKLATIPNEAIKTGKIGPLGLRIYLALYGKGLAEDCSMVYFVVNILCLFILIRC